MKKRFSEEQVIGFLREAETGIPVAEFHRKHAFSDAKRLKERETENTRLNERWLTSLQHARIVIDGWRCEHNEERPKQSLGGLISTAYAKTLIQK